MQTNMQSPKFDRANMAWIGLCLFRGAGILVSTSLLSYMQRAFIAFALALGVFGIAQAEGYDFGKQVSGGGGGGGADPEKKRIVSSRGVQICLDISESPGNQVRFTLRSEIPEPNSRLTSFNLHTGRHANLFTNLAVVIQSPGLKSTIVNPRGSGNQYKIEFPYDYSKKKPVGGFAPGGLAPGNFIVASANLGPGKTFANVISALNEATIPTTESSGLRIWVTAHNLLGGPPPGVDTIQDDATFTVRGVSPRCRWR